MSGTARPATRAAIEDWSIDLSDYAGEQVEISISYVQDFAVDGLGVFLDDVTVTTDGAVTDQTSFESDFGGFEAGPPPPGSEDGTQKAWQRTPSLNYVAGPGVATEDSLAYGFGFEGISDAATRATVMGDAMRYLGVLAGAGPGTPPGGGGGGGDGGGGGGEQPDTKAPKTKITDAPKKKTATPTRSSSSSRTRPARHSSAPSTMASGRTATHRRSTRVSSPASTGSGSGRPIRRATGTSPRRSTAGAWRRRASRLSRPT